MICCVVLGSIFALLARFWRLVSLQAPAPQKMFAPVAYRPAPGNSAFCIPNANLSIPQPVGSMYARGALVRLCIWVIVGYLMVVLGGVQMGQLEVRAAETTWWLRSLIYLALILVLWKRARHPSHAHHCLRPGLFAGAVLVMSGALLTALSVADIHLFGLYGFAGDAHALGHDGHWLSAGYLFMHGAGALMAVAGLTVFWMVQYRQQSITKTMEESC